MCFEENKTGSCDGGCWDCWLLLYIGQLGKSVFVEVTFEPPLFSLQWWFSTRNNFAPPLNRIFDSIWRYFWLWQVAECLLLTSSKERPGMLLNSVQCTGQPPTKNYPSQNISSAKGKKLWLILITISRLIFESSEWYHINSLFQITPCLLFYFLYSLYSSFRLLCWLIPLPGTFFF